MPPRRPKDRGTDAERAVARWLAANGFPHAERRALNGASDRGDITGTPGICWEVKSRKQQPGDEQINAWMDETDAETDNAMAEIGVLIVRRPGYSDTRAGAWWAYLRLDCLLSGEDALRKAPGWDLIDTTPVRMRLADVVAILRAAGYGDAQEVPR